MAQLLSTTDGMLIACKLKGLIKIRAKYD